MASLRIRSASATHVGNVRKLNEDSLLVRPDIGLWAVADGMGGYGAGDIASRRTIAALAALAPPSSAAGLLAAVEAGLAGANAELRALASASGRAVIGTTLVAMLIYDSHFACIWCGDSRAYLLRAGGLRQISRDHSEAQDLVDRGVLEREEAKIWPRRNVVTRALGVADQAELEIVDGPLAAGDQFLLCSDGLTAHVEDAEIAERLGAGDPQTVCDDLVALTLQRGASDNVSVIVLRCEAADDRTVLADGDWARRIVAATEPRKA